MIKPLILGLMMLSISLSAQAQEPRPTLDMHVHAMGVLSGYPERVAGWRESTPGRVIPALF